jgi:hypothetical protein
MKSCQIAGWMPYDKESSSKVLMIKPYDSNHLYRCLRNRKILRGPGHGGKLTEVHNLGYGFDWINYSAPFLSLF